MTLETIAEKMKQTQSMLHDPILIAVEGFGGAGKTTVADKLRGLLDDAFVVSIDDFIIKERIADASWDSGVFDRSRLEAQVLLPLSSGERARYQKLIWETEELSDPVEIPKVKYVIVEGISSYHPDIASYYDFKVWIDTPLKIAQQRGKMRDGASENAEHWGIWANNDAIYKEKYHPEKEADFIFDNTYLV
jgi:uridine kinase